MGRYPAQRRPGASLSRCGMKGNQEGEDRRTGWMMNQSRRNQRPLKRAAIITMVIVGALLAAWCVFAPRITWDGGVGVMIIVNVVDEQTLAPIANATVELRHPRREEASRSFNPEFHDRLIASAATATSGTAQITTAFGAGGGSGIFGRYGEVEYRGKWLRVSADGYGPVRTPLSRFTGETRSIRQNQTSALTIKLVPTQEEP